MTAFPSHFVIWPPPARRPAAPRGLAGAAFAGGSLVVLFWIVYFAGGAVRDAEVAAYEGAFLLADGLFASVLFAAGIALSRGSAAGPFLLVAAASMSLYLGIVDATFYWTRGDFSPPAGVALVELAINALCVAGGMFGLAAGWRHWRRRT